MTTCPGTRVDVGYRVLPVPVQPTRRAGAAGVPAMSDHYRQHPVEAIPESRDEGLQLAHRNSCHFVLVVAGTQADRYLKR
ncbi:hypothetical protein D3C78_1796000 [compost metagenome]